MSALLGSSSHHLAASWAGSSEMETTYAIVSGNSPTALESAVNEALQKGGQLQGGPVTANFVWYQAIVRNAPAAVVRIAQ